MHQHNSHVITWHSTPTGMRVVLRRRACCEVYWCTAAHTGSVKAD
jgi:hypothetical protein